MTQRHVGLLGTVLLLLAACGATTSSGSSSSSGGGGDGGACVASPTEGSLCSDGQEGCKSGDSCCTGIWTCDTSSHTWRHLGLGCPCIVDASTDGAQDAAKKDAGSVVCGNLTCHPDEYCRVSSGGAQQPDGAPPPVGYECVPVPSACTSDFTCTCLQSHGESCTCNEQNGVPSVGCMAP